MLNDIKVCGLKMISFKMIVISLILMHVVAMVLRENTSTLKVPKG